MNEIAFDVVLLLENRTQQHDGDQSRLRKLTGFQAFVVPSRTGRGVVADPGAVMTAQLIKIVVPMAAQAEGIADQPSDDGPCRAILNHASTLSYQSFLVESEMANRLRFGYVLVWRANKY